MQTRVYEQLRDRRLRPTAARAAVLQAMHEADGGYRNAEQVYLALYDSGMRFSMASIYRVLQELSLAGLLLRHWSKTDQAGKSSFVLAPAVLPPDVYLAICPVCQRQMPIKDSTFADNLHRVAQGAGFDAGLHGLALSVTCNDCVTPQSA
ncbi:MULTISPECIES: Fur family transcriptional regulator [unclassified Duganella]|uniref:Fur family transcriptional regulator n=1 Tax=unclassified Duganella TaxID=2636909 RepID=UPI00088E0D2E|nr:MULTISPECIES: transcriptional repressor [unclassified Duganella]SDF75258.1 Ferric uptake regulator family protein [Duganella sp. OV458]SDI54327.1 Fe2+ or Zn2+ uptake regulation protein [Duganella sp. OV510]